MVLIKKLEGKSPKFGKNIFLAENATIIGDVIIGDNVIVSISVNIAGHAEVDDYAIIGGWCRVC